MSAAARSPARLAGRRSVWSVLGHSWPAAALAFLTGVPATAAGAGIGLRFLTTTGLTGTSLVGLALLAAGLILLGFAAIVSWRVTRGWYHLLLLPVAIVGLLVTASMALGVMLAYAPRSALGSVTPASRGLAFSNVTFRTSDGVRLSAWYLPSSDHAAIVTLPGSGSTRAATLGQAAVLARRGFGVLMVDPRGQGRSGGHAMDAGWYGDRDVAAAVRFLREHRGIEPGRIGVLGLSMGGEEAIGAAAADPAIRAVVAEGATNRTAADKAGFLPGGLAGAIQRVMDRITYGTAALLSPAPEPGPLHAAIAHAQHTRFLLIAAGNAVDEPEATAYLRTAAPGRVATWVVPGSSHVHGLATAPAAWTAHVVRFFDSTLLARTPAGPVSGAARPGR